MSDDIFVNYYEINGRDYIVLNEVDYNNNHYVYLCNEFDKKDLMVRKVIGDVLEPLDSDAELVEVLKLIVK